MVLYKRKPVQILQNPVIDDESQEVWQISQTGETFTSYAAYVDRLDFYKSKQFSCEITGHMNLNYFEALNSETTHSADVEQAFPEPLKEPVLRKVQFSTTSRIDTLVDSLHDSFKSDFYPGEHVTAILSSGDRVDAVIREKTMFPELRYANGEIQRKGFSRYTVKLTGRNDEEAQIDNEHLIRDKKTFTKAMLRSFIKNTVSREPWNGAPWLVKDEFATKYKIPQDVPPHLQRGNTAAERKAAQARRKQGSAGLSVGALTNDSSPPPAAPVEIKPKSHKSKAQQVMKMSKLVNGGQNPDDANGAEWASSPGGTPEGKNSRARTQAEPSPAPPPPPPKPIKYPIEDLDVPREVDAEVVRPKLNRLSSLEIVKIGSDGDAIEEDDKEDAEKNKSPTPKEKINNGINEEKVQFFLSTWVYLNIYCEPLVLDSFTFDDYVQALLFKCEDVDCPLLVEIHCALLKALVNEQGVVQAQLPEPEVLEEEYEEEYEEEHQEEQGEEGAQQEDKMETSQDEQESQEDEDADNRTTTEKVHTVHELWEEDDSWILRAKARDFKNGGWEAIIVGLLHQLSTDRRFTRDISSALAHLAPPDYQPTFETVKRNYISLDCNDRVMIISTLSRLTHETRTVREYMEECAEEMTKQRKEKIEHQRARKAYLEELKGLEDDKKILLPENTPSSAPPTPSSRQPSSDEDGDVKMNGVDDDEDASASEDGDPVRGLRRGGERKRKREEEKSKAEAAAKIPKTSKEFQKVVKKIETIQAKIAHEEQMILNIDEDLRQADCARFRMMGKDRYWNTYWWFERNGMPFGGLPTSSTAVAEYANAMVWVQGPDETERQGFLVEEAGTRRFTDPEGDVEMNGHGGSGLPVLERQAVEESGTTLTSPTQYGFIDTPEAFEQLLNWLDVRGVREKKLKAAFEPFRKQIIKGMENRQKYLSGADEAEGEQQHTARSTRGKQYLDPSSWRCLNWKNDAMLEEYGHTHYDQPMPRGKKGKKKGGDQATKDLPLNRQGKPVSRQGERYNF